MKSLDSVVNAVYFHPAIQDRAAPVAIVATQAIAEAASHVVRLVDEDQLDRVFKGLGLRAKARWVDVLMALRIDSTKENDDVGRRILEAIKRVEKPLPRDVEYHVVKALLAAKSALRG